MCDSSVSFNFTAVSALELCPGLSSCSLKCAVNYTLVKNMNFQFFWNVITLKCSHWGFWVRIKIRWQNETTNSVNFFILCNFLHVFALKERGVRALFVSLNAQRKTDILNYRVLEIISFFICSFSHLTYLGRYRVPCLFPYLVSLKLLQKARPQSKPIDWNNILNNFTLQIILLHQMQWIQIWLK